jgi:hypothetical protein
VKTILSLFALMTLHRLADLERALRLSLADAEQRFASLTAPTDQHLLAFASRCAHIQFGLRMLIELRAAGRRKIPLLWKLQLIRSADAKPPCVPTLAAIDAWLFRLRHICDHLDLSIRLCREQRAGAIADPEAHTAEDARSDVGCIAAERKCTMAPDCDASPPPQSQAPARAADDPREAFRAPSAEARTSGVMTARHRRAGSASPNDRAAVHVRCAPMHPTIPTPTTRFIAAPRASTRSTWRSQGAARAPPRRSSIHRLPRVAGPACDVAGACASGLSQAPLPHTDGRRD